MMSYTGDNLKEELAQVKTDRNAITKRYIHDRDHRNNLLERELEHQKRIISVFMTCIEREIDCHE